MSATARDVFISHSSADAAVARALRDDLAAEGLSAWLAPDDIDARSAWATQILQAVDSCRVVVVLLSAAANESTHVAREVNLASSRHKPVLPIRIEPVRPEGALEYLLTLVQRVDAYPPPAAAHFQRVRAAVARLLVEGAPTGEGTSRPDAPANRAVLDAEELKTVTVLCAGVRRDGATASTDDPEDHRAEMEPYAALIRREVEGYGGSVTRSVGDSTIAVWGAPQAQEDAPERAVRAAIAMLQEVERLGTTAGRGISIGIASGPAIVAVGDRHDPTDPLVTGDVVTSALRLQDEAAPGMALADRRTAEATRGHVDYAASGDGPLADGRAHLVLGVRSRLGADVDQRPSTDLIGRELERAILLATFDRSVRDARTQLVTIVGEPGIGKSRLLADLAASLHDRPTLIRWRQGRCLPYGEGISFWALGEIVKAQLGILESDTAETAATKLEAGLPEVLQDREWLKVRLGSLLGLAASPAPQEENFSAWRSFLERVVASTPAVLVFEDLHWADDALLDFITHLSDSTADVALVMVCTARPELLERRTTWGSGRRNSSVIELPQLGNADVSSLIRAVLADASIDAATEHLIVERSSGNPLFVQEYVRLLRDGSLLTGRSGQVPFPDSIQALIAARLDLLARDQKAVIHDAAVIGKVFWRGGVAAIEAADPLAIDRQLFDLARKDLVRPAGSSSLAEDAEFSFHHILVRDVSYEQIPKARRAEKHLAAARWLESRVAGRSEDLADVLAFHYTQALELGRGRSSVDLPADIPAKALQYLILAGDRALALDVARAQQHYERALALLEPSSPDRPMLLERWAAAAQGGKLQEAADALNEAITTYRAAGDKASAGRALTALSRVLSRLGDVSGDGLMEEAVAILEQEPPGPDLIEAYAGMSAAEGGRGHFEGAIALADKALGLAERLGLPVPPRALGFRGLFRCLDGHGDGIGDLREALQLALQRGMGREAAVSYANLAFASGMHLGPAKGLEVNREALAFAERTGRMDIAANLATNQAFLLYVTGEWDEALAVAGSSGSMAAAVGSVELKLARWVEVAIKAYRGSARSVSETAQWLVDGARLPNEVQWIIPGYTAAALVARLTGRLAAARDLVAEAEALPNARADSNQYLLYLPENIRTALAAGDLDLARRLASGVEAQYPTQSNDLLTARAAIAAAAGDAESAATQFTAAAEAWNQIGNVPELAWALIGAGNAFLSLGRSVEAAAAWGRAREVVDRLGAVAMIEGESGR